MKFWNRKPKKEKSKGIKAPVLLNDKNHGEHYALDCCEQMIGLLNGLDEAKVEYQIVTSHLNDIQEIEQIPKEQREEINSVALEIAQLSEKRKEFQNSTSKIPDIQYLQMQKYEEGIPEAIRRLKENETYLAAVKRDMNHLEGEKGSWNYERRDLLAEQKNLRKVLFIISSLFISIFVITFILQSTYNLDTKMIYLVTCFIAAVSGFCIFFRNQRNSLKIQQVQINLNHAITILNRIKTKYVNSANVVEYECVKYSVHSGHEFEYFWNQYLLMKEQRKVYHRSSGDLENYNQDLVHMLRTFNIQEPAIWIYQAIALVDNKEMVEIRHNLIARRQKLRSRIEFNSNKLKEIKKEVSEFLKQNPSYEKEIEEILSSIDSLGAI